MSIPAEIEVLTLFVDDLVAARHFYRKVFAAKLVYVDDVSSVLEFGNLISTFFSHRKRQSWYIRQTLRLRRQTLSEQGTLTSGPVKCCWLSSTFVPTNRHRL